MVALRTLSLVSRMVDWWIGCMYVSVASFVSRFASRKHERTGARSVKKRHLMHIHRITSQQQDSQSAKTSLFPKVFFLFFCSVRLGLVFCFSPNLNFYCSIFALHYKLVIYATIFQWKNIVEFFILLF